MKSTLSWEMRCDALAFDASDIRDYVHRLESAAKAALHCIEHHPDKLECCYATASMLREVLYAHE
jgi:hypothetical protein